MKNLLSATLAFALAACAHGPLPTDAGRHFNDSKFSPPTEPISAKDVFALSPAMERYVETDIAGKLYNRGGRQALVDALYSKGELRIERVDAFVARFGRLQDTLAGALLPRLLEALLEPVGSVLDNLNRAERLGWLRSSSDWAELRLLRNRMVHETVRDAQELVDALLAAHRGVADLAASAAAMAGRARELAG